VIKLSELPPPDIIETLDYEQILENKKQRLQQLDPEFTALLESDPAMKVLEIAAWDELLLRQRVNDTARANLLAFAKGSDLDQLGIFSEVERFEKEDDAAYRQRVRAKNQGSSVAGSFAHYRHQALSADIGVKDARPFSPEAGLVKIAVLSKDGDGRPSEALLTKVRDMVTSEQVRVLTDTVEVIACEIVDITVKASIHLYPETQAEIIEAIKQDFVQSFNEHRTLGWDVTASWVSAHLFAKGIHRVEIKSPSSDVVIHDTACASLKALELDIQGYDW